MYKDFLIHNHSIVTKPVQQRWHNFFHADSTQHHHPSKSHITLTLLIQLCLCTYIVELSLNTPCYYNLI